MSKVSIEGYIKVKSELRKASKHVRAARQSIERVLNEYRFLLFEHEERELERMLIALRNMEVYLG